MSRSDLSASIELNRIWANAGRQGGDDTPADIWNTRRSVNVGVPARLHDGQAMPGYEFGLPCVLQVKRDARFLQERASGTRTVWTQVE